MTNERLTHSLRRASRKGRRPVKWNADSISDNLFSATPVDVYVPDVCADLRWNWLVSVDEKGSESDALIVAEPEGTLLMGMADGEKIPDSVTLVVKGKMTPIDRHTNVVLVNHPNARKTIADGRTVIKLSVWTREQITDALNVWADRFGNEIRFEFDPDVNSGPLSQ